MIDVHWPKLSVARQCQLLGMARSSYYYQAKGESAFNLLLMRQIDEQYLNTPWYGSRQMARHLRRQGHVVGRKRIRRLMALMGLSAVAPGPQTSRRSPQHKIYPYLLRDRKIDKANQVWCADVTYLPMAHGFLYLVAIMDWHSRRVLAWRVSTTQDTGFCVEALEEAIECFGTPAIFNTDQGSQFTSEAWTDTLLEHDIEISMDGKGRWMDNVFIERLWRSCKYECVYLHAFENLRQAQDRIGDWMNYYNQERPHSTFGDLTPDEVYQGLTDLRMAA
jgi:putative transposase